jgi:hypothetical protein
MSVRLSGSRLTQRASYAREKLQVVWIVSDLVLVRPESRSSSRFEANRGQTDKRVDFLARAPGYFYFITDWRSSDSAGDHFANDR